MIAVNPVHPSSPFSWRFRGILALVLLAFAGPYARASDPASDEAAWGAFSKESAPNLTVALEPAATGVKVDVYLPPAPTSAARPGLPVVMLLHGGGWGGGSNALLAPHARYLAASGFAVVNVAYRLTSAPGVTLAQAGEDARAGFAWIQAEAANRGWDANRISVMGESAGGELACALGILPPDAKRWRAHSLVLVNPVLDLTSLTWTRNQPGLHANEPFNPASPEKDPAWKFSALFHLTGDAPPTLVLHGRNDATVPITQAEAFAAKGKAVGAKVELVTLNGAEHAFLLVGYGKPEVIHDSLKRIVTFLREP